MKLQYAKVTVAVALCTCFSLSASAQQNSDRFVQRAGTKLTLNGQPFRYSGPNIEWLGLEGYGPHDPQGPRYPSRFEVDDAFATAAEMGAKVVRSQTMADSVGCPLCIEPEQGKFNDAAFASSDYALLAARQHGMRIILSLVGDCATCNLGGIGQYIAWQKKQNPQDFFTDPALISAFEKHIDAVLNHVNGLTGVRYKDDPTILAWENCNMCGLITLFLGGRPEGLKQVADWVETIGEHIKSIDPHHLYLDTTGIFRAYPAVLDGKSSDLVTFEYYPHWDALFGGGQAPTTSASFTADAAAVTAHHKAYIVNEFGWDRTDWKSQDDLQQVLDTLLHDPNISGDDYWALQAHMENFGFQPIPADCTSIAYALAGECGEWWALYYPGVKTIFNSADDMAQRAQQLRAHAFAMAGVPVPTHSVPPRPVITSIVFGGLIAWRGSAGAVRYSVERKDPGSPDWKNICERCATDSDDPWPDPHPVSFGAQYRVTAWNADGVASPPSDPR